MLKALDDFLNHKESSPKLSNQQLDALEHYLDSHAAQNAMHMEVLDGFLCALITSPSPVNAEEYLPVIFGGKMPEFKSQEESDQIMGALAQHWEHIDSVLKRNDEILSVPVRRSGRKMQCKRMGIRLHSGNGHAPRQLERNGRNRQARPGRLADPCSDAVLRIHSGNFGPPAHSCGRTRRTGHKDDFQSGLADLRTFRGSTRKKTVGRPRCIEIRKKEQIEICPFSFVRRFSTDYIRRHGLPVSRLPVPARYCWRNNVRSRF